MYDRTMTIQSNHGFTGSVAGLAGEAKGEIPHEPVTSDNRTRVPPAHPAPGRGHTIGPYGERTLDSYVRLAQNSLPTGL